MTKFELPKLPPLDSALAFESEFSFPLNWFLVNSLKDCFPKDEDTDKYNMIFIKDDIPFHIEKYPERHMKGVYKDGIIPWVRYNKEENGILETVGLLPALTEAVKEFTGSNKVYCLRSWWVVIQKDQSLPRHTHRYQKKERTISGCFWIDGDPNPLWVKEPSGSTRMIENKPGRVALFDGFVEHWCDMYKSDKTRYSIAFDFLVEDQLLCDCEPKQVCVKCTQNKLDLIGITAYTGGTESTDLKNHQWVQKQGHIIKNPYLGKLQHK